MSVKPRIQIPNYGLRFFGIRINIVGTSTVSGYGEEIGFLWPPSPHTACR